MEVNPEKCPVCKEDFSSTNERKAPYLLYCSHNICLDDLTHLIEQQQNQEAKDGIILIHCPICNMTIDFSAYGEDENYFPPLNQSLMDNLAYFHATTDGKGGGGAITHDCEECFSNKAEIYCPKCEAKYCGNCNEKIHTFSNTLKKHQRISIEEYLKGYSSNGNSSPSSFHSPMKASVPPPPSCLYHGKITPENILNFYCSDLSCQRLICSYCAIQEPHHKGHNILPIQDAYDIIHTTFQNIELNQQATKRKQLEEYFQKLKELEHQNSQIHQSNLMRLNHDFQYIYEVLQKYHQDLVQKLTGDYQEHFNDLNMQKIELVQLLNDYEILNQKSLICSKFSSPHQFLEEQTILLHSSQILTNQMKDFFNRSILPQLSFQYLLEFSPPHPQENSEQISLPNPESIEPHTSNETSVKGDVDTFARDKLGLIASYLLSSLNSLSNSLNFYERLIVTDIKELESKETFYEYSSVIVKSGGILTIPQESIGVLFLKIQGTLLIEPGGELNLVGKGYRGGNGSFQTDTVSEDGISGDEGLGGKGGIASARYGTIGGGGGGYMTDGKNAKPNTQGGQCTFGGYGGKALQIIPSDNIESYLRVGTGGGGGSGINDCGGTGGNGGGMLIIEAYEIRNLGTITVNGGNGQEGDCGNNYISGGGGGSGGSIKLEANSIINHGSITASGGEGGIATYDDNSPLNNCSSGGDGGDGLIILKCTSFHGNGKIKPEPKKL